MSAKPTFTSVSDYLSALEVEQAKALKPLLALVQKAVPESTRVISYRMPAFKLDRVFMYCAAFKRHIGIYPPVKNDAKLTAALTPYANSKGNLSFSLDEPMPKTLITRVAKALARQYSQTRNSRVKHKGSK